MKRMVYFAGWIRALIRRLRPARPSFERCLRDAITTKGRVTLRVTSLERVLREPAQNS